MTTVSDLVELREPARRTIHPPGLGEIPGGWTERAWHIAGREFRLTLPADPDAFLDDPAVQQAHDETQYMPYWAYLWPSALHMARLIRRAEWAVGSDALELGCGVGLAGMAALSRGCRVTFSDYEPQAVALALHNAKQNGLAASARGDVFDWNRPPARQYPIILGCEVVYEDRNHEPILRLLQRMLAPQGVAWFGDGGRWRADRFARLLGEFGFEAELRDETGAPLPAPRAGRFQLFQVRRR
jgi:predicted nicotinamide N-methyase